MKMDSRFLTLFASLIALSVESGSQWDTVDVSYNLMKEENVKIHNTKQFRRQPGLHVRHNAELLLAMALQHEHCDKAFEFKLLENGNSIFTWTQRPLVKDGELHFHLYVNRSIPVGQYKLSTSDPCSHEGKLTDKKTVHLTDLNVMFNPVPAEWDKDDTRARRQVTNNVLMTEYIGNNCGYIWTGSVAIPWNYAVGSQVVTSALNTLIQLMSPSERSNEVLYSRALTRLINRYVLYGRWDGRYSDGVEPTRWVGSEAILAHWLRTQSRIRYGQCWVFAALLTTLLRASGIPARTVTNYNSHHDRGLTDDRSAVLRQYDNIVQPDEDTWNFHVWSEAWLARPDLRRPADWNVVDATPQEPSPLAPNQPYQAGPAYVPYIRSNIRTASYDTFFILAEVNAVEICPITGRVLSSNVGYAVVTKRPGMHPTIYNYYNYESITTNYKISSIKRASGDTDPVLPPPYTGCEREGGMRLNITPSSPRVGDDFTVIVTEGNVSAEDTVIRIELRSYMGESLEMINVIVGVKELNMTEMDYLPYLSNSSIFRFSVGEYNESGDFVFHDALRIQLTYDEIAVEAMKEPHSTNITLTLTYMNPLSIAMPGVVVSVASPDNSYIRLEEGEIAANSLFTTTVEVDCGDEEGDVMIPISLDSDVTQSAYGLGWTSCRNESMNGGSVVLRGISVMQMTILSLLVLLWFA